MTQLDYFFSHLNGNTVSYQLIQFSVSEPWRIVLDGECLGSIEKMGKDWRQLTGNDLDATFLTGITTFIESQHFNSLPDEILSRWPKLIKEVVMKSDEEYLIICKAGIHFASFERIFTRFIPGLLKDEWPVSFQVYNHDFSADFTFQARLTEKIKEAGYIKWDS